jgi:hypothetical protein
MDMRGVVPAGGEARRVAVEDDPAPHEYEALDEALDRAELVRDEHDRDVEVAVQLLEKCRERLLGVDVDPGRGFVEYEQVGLSGERLGDEGPLLLTARQGRERRGRTIDEADALDRLLDDGPIALPQRAKQADARDAAGRDDFAHADGRIDSELGSLGKIADPRALAEAHGPRSEQARGSLLRAFEPQGDSKQRCLTAAVRTCDRDELTQLDLQADIPEHGHSAWIGEGDVSELDR